MAALKLPVLNFVSDHLLCFFFKLRHKILFFNLFPNISVEKLPKTCLTRLVQTLTSMLCQQLEQSDSSVEMAIECTTPWVLLHRVVSFEEQLQPKCQDSIPAHISILLTAHECMAKYVNADS